MARPLRVELPGGLYHVIVRGDERKAVFRDDRDRGQAVKGNEAFADRMLHAAWEPRVLPRNLTFEAVARKIAQAQEIGPGQMMT